MQDLLNRPALLLLVLALAAAAGWAAGRAEGALRAALVAVAGLFALLAWDAARFGLPDALGLFVAGVGGAALALVAAWLAPRLVHAP